MTRPSWRAGRWLVCGKYELEVELAQADSTSGHRPFHEFPMSFMGQHAVCKEALVRALSPMEYVTELFGGMGLTGSCFRAEHPLRDHELYEKNEDLVRHLRSNGFEAHVGDAFEVVYDLPPRDCVDADFGRFTVLQWNRDVELRRFVEKLFTGEHRFIMFTDEAIHYLHTNLPLYSAALGWPVTGLASYLDGWSHVWGTLYGYAIVRAEYNSGACYTLWAREPFAPVEPRRTQAPYRGVVPVL